APASRGAQVLVQRRGEPGGAREQVVVPTLERKPREDQRAGGEVEEVRGGTRVARLLRLGQRAAARARRLLHLLAEMSLERDLQLGEELEGKLSPDVDDHVIVAQGQRSAFDRQR